MGTGTWNITSAGGAVLALLIAGVALLSGSDEPSRPTVTAVPAPADRASAHSPSNQSDMSPLAPAGDNAQTVTLQREIARLQAEVARLRKAANTPRPVTGAGPAGSEPTEDPDGQERSVDAWQHAEREFQREPIDPVWSSETLERIAALLRQPRLASLQIADADCRSAHCRLVITGEHGTSATQQLVLLTLALGADLPEVIFSPRDAEVDPIVVLLAKPTPGVEPPAR